MNCEIWSKCEECLFSLYSYRYTDTACMIFGEELSDSMARDMYSENLPYWCPLNCASNDQGMISINERIFPYD